MERWIGVLLLAAVPLSGAAATNFRALLFDAMHSPTGTIVTEIDGPVADKIRGDINQPTAKVMGEISTVDSLPQEGCKTMRIRFFTPGTLLPTKDGKGQMLDMQMRLNMCPNGLPPGAVDAPQAPRPPFRQSM